MDLSWTCHCCGERHDSLPLAFFMPAPAPWYDVPPEERDRRVQMSTDMCIIDGEQLFLLGCLDLPIRGHAEPFRYGVWVSLSEASYDRVIELWGADIPDDEPSRFGWLSSSLLGYPETYRLKTAVHLRSGGIRPFIELEPTDHPLAIEQREGITIERVQEIAASLLHGNQRGG